MSDIKQIEIRNLLIEDYEQLKETMTAAYENWTAGHWEKHHIEKLLRLFPEGQIAIVVDDQVVGCALTLRIKYSKFGDKHTYNQIIGNSSFDTFDAKGDVLYGIDVFIKPNYRGLRLGRRLYDARKELCEHMNLRAIVFGGRIPNYYKYAEKYTPKQYIAAVRAKEIFDPVLTFQLSNDFHVKKLLTGYLPYDKESHENAVLMQWDNIYYNEDDTAMSNVKSVVRLGLVQWQMRPHKNLDEFFDQAEFFVDAVSNYKSDFALFPEFFNAPMMMHYNDLNEAQAIRKLAEFTEPIRERFVQYAMSYNVNIITGSMPLMEDGKLYNVGYFCHRNGDCDRYDKIHITPDEAKFWGMTGGNKVKIIQSDCGPVGVVVCYDVEFPELGRILAEQDMNILFVPFLTDTQNGYGRVRNCARARAIENECYVAIAGSVGNLPKVHNMDIQYAQSAVFTPCDFAFPYDGVKAEATPNTEMILLVEVDITLLRELHERGSVRNLKDRRHDLYQVKTLF
ncbi:MAG TPA: carbon-nitrogen hydrolase [Phycisphaerales bacterium]|nr:carbon-nitrogen hydrolase [Phycisphaerales bacterium]|tara:strand:- start:16291 stop:17814 length:1524 start_codon:yes stop_codon:yes gene_type:complete